MVIKLPIMFYYLMYLPIDLKDMKKSWQSELVNVMGKLWMLFKFVTTLPDIFYHLCYFNMTVIYFNLISIIIV